MRDSRLSREDLDLLFPETVPELELSDRFYARVVRWEGLPHNRAGADKTWVERFLAESARQIREAVCRS